MKKIAYFFGHLLLVLYTANAQDPQFSQFYAAPLYQNPAFAGSALAPRIITNYRNQWSALGNNFSTSAFGVDNYFSSANSGVGILWVNDARGLGRLQTNSVQTAYSYQLRLSENTSLRAGLQGGYIFKRINAEGLTFGDQYNATGLNGSTSIDAGLLKEAKTNFLDASAGLLLSNSHFWFGGAVHHFNQPNQGFLGRAEDILRMKISVQAGLNIPIFGVNDGLGHNVGREASISPTVLFKQQGAFRQLDAGLYFTYSPLTLGAWYRGIPVIKTSSTTNQDALIFLVGLRQEAFSIGYSYDVTVSKLGIPSGGSHEISFAYVFDPFPKNERSNLKRRKKELSCPKF